MRLATREDFEPANSTELAEAMYGALDPSGTPEGYRRYPHLSKRVNELNQRFAPNGQKLLVAGCAFGFLVDDLVGVGYDAYGIDASAWAIGRSNEVLPGIAARVGVVDATVESEINDFRRNVMGIQGNRKIDLAVTEDLLPVLRDDEIPLALAALRAQTQANLLHIVTPSDMPGTEYPGDYMQPGQLNDSQADPINWKTTAEWLAIVSPPDVLVTAPDYQVVT